MSDTTKPAQPVSKVSTMWDLKACWEQPSTEILPELKALDAFVNGVLLVLRTTGQDVPTNPLFVMCKHLSEDIAGAAPKDVKYILHYLYAMDGVTSPERPVGQFCKQAYTYI